MPVRMRKVSYSIAKEIPQTVSAAALSEKSRTALQVIADKAGICLSVICIVHCLLTPALLLALPAMQFFDWWHESLHITFAVIIPVLALAAFIPGYRLHREKRVFKIAAVGFVLVISAITIPHILGIEWLEAVLSVAGSIFLVRAHLLNRHLCTCCRTGHGKH